MNIAAMKTITVIALGVSVVAYAGIVWAHGFNGSLGKKKIATDIYQVTCSNEEGGTTPTYRLSTKVRDLLPKRRPKVSVWTMKDGTTTQTTDTKDGNAGYSPAAFNNNGNGVYILQVTKSWREPENYAVQFHCEGPPPGFIHTGTDYLRIQNQ